MKRFLMLLAFIGFSVGTSEAIDTVWSSSNTETASVTTALSSVNVLCDQTQYAVLHGICTNFGVAASSVAIVNSTFTYTNVKIIGPVTTLVADQCKYYDTFMGKGLGYHKPNVAGLTILYACY